MIKNNKSSESLPFFKVPKILFTDKKFSDMSLDAKMLYSLLLDRLSLSRKNKWYDSRNRLYIIFTVKEIGEVLNCGKSKAIKLLKELSDIGLIERLKRGKNLADLIYVNCIAGTENDTAMEQAEDADETDTQEKFIEKSSKQDTHISDTGDNSLSYGGVKNRPYEVSKSAPTNTDMSNTDYKAYIDRWIDKRRNVRTEKHRIRNQIDYGALARNYPYDKRLLDEIVESIMEIYFIRGGTDIAIGKHQYSVEYVRYRFDQINYNTVNYIMDCMRNNRSKIKNIKNYMTAVLFNATSTCDSYYQNEVSSEVMADTKRFFQNVFSKRKTYFVRA